MSVRTWMGWTVAAIAVGVSGLWAFAAPKGDIIRGIRAARVHIEIFGNDGGEYGPKHLWCNGGNLVELPEKQEPDAWETAVIDVPSENLWLIRRTCVLRVIQPRRDCFKFRNVSLELQGPDGGWVLSSTNTAVQCSGEKWTFAEGTPFVDTRYSAELPVTFPDTP